MLRRALYLLVIVAAFAAALSVRLGWWDIGAARGRAWGDRDAIVFYVGGWMLAALSAWGMTFTVRIKRLPARLRMLPAHFTVMLVSFVFFGVVRLSPEMSAGEAAIVVGRYAAAGAFVGLVAGLLRGAHPRPVDDLPRGALHQALIGGAACIAVVGALLLFTAWGQALLHLGE